MSSVSAHYVSWVSRPAADSFDSFTNSDDSIEVILNRANIAWDTDRSVRFRNPGGAAELDPDTLHGTTMPPNWPRNLSAVPGGLQNESLMVWFRVSAFPWFRKLYARPEVNGSADGVLPIGDYSITLTYSILTLERVWLSWDSMLKCLHCQQHQTRGLTI